MTDCFTETENLIRVLRKFELDIRKALGYGGHTHSYEYVAAACIAGQFDIFILPNSVIIAELIEYPTQKVYHQFIACGDLDELLEAQNGLLIREAKLRGAKALTLAGRRGWLRTLEPHGWKSDLVLMRKELDYGQDTDPRDDARDRPASSGELGSQHGASEDASWAGLSTIRRH